MVAHINSRPFVVLLVVTAASAFLVSRLALGRQVAIEAPRAPGIVSELFRANQDALVTETILVYIGSSTCLWSNKPEFAVALASVVDSLTARAIATGVPVTIVGIDLRPKPGRELDHLKHLARFDQVALGGSFMNLAGISVVGRNRFAGETPTPQLMVISRRARKVSARGEQFAVELDTAVVLTRKVGLTEITNWVRAGVSVPRPGWLAVRNAADAGGPH